MDIYKTYLAAIFIIVLQNPLYVLAQQNESVLIAGAKVCAKNELNEFAEICIEAKDNNIRVISLGGESETVKMEERLNRWYGLLGLINSEPAKWKNHKFVSRANIEEAQINYDNIGGFINWRNNYFDKNTGVYRDDGLSIRWSVAINPNSNDHKGVLGLGIYQIMINGQKPNKLPGSNNASIIVKEEAKGKQKRETKGVYHRIIADDSQL